MSEEQDDLSAPGDEVWDEYRWEAYIRRQDDHADEYLAMLEYYSDESDAHNLIARSMGWDHLLTNCSGAPDPARCSDCPAPRRQLCRFYESYFGRRQRLRRQAHGPLAWEVEGEEDISQRTVHGAQHAQWDMAYGRHAVHGEAFALVSRLSEVCGRLPGGYPEINNPLCRLLHHVHRCVGKIAGSLKQYVEPTQRGQVIANLKMSFQAACLALAQTSDCAAQGALDAAASADVTQRLLTIRQHLLDLIDDFRTQITRLQHSRRP